MTNCCSPSTETAHRPVCPGSGDVGRPVTITTLQSLLTAVAAEALDPSKTFYFCPGTQCDIVYFSKESGQVFKKVDVRVRVGQKETSSPRPVCYCFGHSYESIKAEIEQRGASTVVDDIKTKMKTSGCACEVKNPQGSCCLGNVAQAVKAASAATNSK